MTDTPQIHASFAATLAEGMKILTLGRALSRAHPGTLSQRDQNGFLLGELRAGPQERPPTLALATPEGRITGESPPGLDGRAAVLHAAVLRARHGAEAAMLVRAPRLAAWGLSRRPLPVRYFQMFGYTRAREIPVASPHPHDIEAALAANPDTPALLLDDGRALIWAPQPARAVRLVLSLEEAAHVTALAEELGGAQDYPDEARDKIYLSLQAQARR